jgi:hypothetical protein
MVSGTASWFPPAQGSQNVARIAGKAVARSPVRPGALTAGAMIVVSRATAFAARPAPRSAEGFDNGFGAMGSS